MIDAAKYDDINQLHFMSDLIRCLLAGIYTFMCKITIFVVRITTKHRKYSGKQKQLTLLE